MSRINFFKLKIGEVAGMGYNRYLLKYNLKRIVNKVLHLIIKIALFPSRLAYRLYRRNKLYNVNMTENFRQAVLMSIYHDLRTVGCAYITDFISPNHGEQYEWMICSKTRNNLDAILGKVKADRKLEVEEIKFDGLVLRWDIDKVKGCKLYRISLK